VIDAPTISALVQNINGPINIMAGPGAPSIPELGSFGVARVSLGPNLALAALAATQRAALELLRFGTYTELETGFSFSDANSLFTRA
jgi:2-methylisocitrate lyase-like PEP mutase family enzyme